MKKILSLLLIITIFACGIINAAADSSISVGEQVENSQSQKPSGGGSSGGGGSYGVSVEGIENGQTIEFGDEVSVAVSAAGDFDKIVLYLNEEEVGTTESGAALFTLTDVPSGRNVLRAEKTKENAVVAVSEPIEFFYITIEENIIAFDDFENGLENWELPSDGSLKVAEGENYEGKALIFDPGAKQGSWPAKPELKSSAYNQLPASGFSFEFDAFRDMDHDTSPVVYAKILMRTDVSSSIDLGGIRRESGIWTPSVSTFPIVSSKAVKLQNRAWHHIKYDINLSLGTADLYIANGKGNDSNMTLVGSMTFAPCSSITRVHFEANGYGHATDSNPLLMIDDIVFKESASSPYLEKPRFEVYGEAVEEGKIPANPTVIKVPFSIQMDESTISSDAFEFTSGAEEVDVANITYNKADNEVVITPVYPLISEKSYRLTVADTVVAANGMGVQTPLVSAFKTPLNDFDVTAFNVAGEFEALKKEDIQVGTPTKFECIFRNLSYEAVEGVAVFAAYENGALAYMEVQPFNIAANTEIGGVGTSGEYIPKSVPDYVEVFLWKSMSERISLAPSKILE